jgi:hypothetical protein
MDCFRETVITDVSSMWLKNNLKTLFILMPGHLAEVVKLEG